MLDFADMKTMFLKKRNKKIVGLIIVKSIYLSLSCNGLAQREATRVYFE